MESVCWLWWQRCCQEDDEREGQEEQPARFAVPPRCSPCAGPLAHSDRLVSRHDIINVTGIGMTQFGRAELKLFLRVLNANVCYPESVLRMCSVGNGWMAVGLWRIISPFVPVGGRVTSSSTPAAL